MNSDRRINWDIWLHVPTVRLWEGVALSLNIEPSRVLMYGIGSNEALAAGHPVFREEEEFKDRLFVATRNLDVAPELKLISENKHPEYSEVSLSGFAAWARSVKWKVPIKLTQLGKRWTNPGEMTEVVPAKKWPWGDHETKLLQHLHYAAHNFWTTYDPDNPSTAPTNKAVEDYLKERGVATRVAQIMAQILRADDLKTGPRK